MGLTLNMGALQKLECADMPSPHKELGKLAHYGVTMDHLLIKNCPMFSNQRLHNVTPGLLQLFAPWPPLICSFPFNPFAIPWSHSSLLRTVALSPYFCMYYALILGALELLVYPANCYASLKSQPKCLS